MRIEWSALVLLAAEFTFAVLFLRALGGYLRRRDYLEGNVTLVFLPCTVVFCADIARRISGGLGRNRRRSNRRHTEDCRRNA
jgi:hypothetical protein